MLMRPAWKNRLIGAAVTYLILGTYLGVGMARMIPAINPAGTAYYVVMWPAFIASAAYGAPAPPIPTWVFTHTTAPDAPTS